MGLIQIVAVLVVLGVVFYLIETQIPMSPLFAALLRIVIVLALCAWLLSLVGIIPPIKW